MVAHDTVDAVAVGSIGSIAGTGEGRPPHTGAADRPSMAAVAVVAAVVVVLVRSAFAAVRAEADLGTEAVAVAGGAVGWCRDAADNRHMRLLVGNVVAGGNFDRVSEAST